MLLETLREVLTTERFQVVCAPSGEAAEQLLASAQPPFELVLTDLVMPGRSGMDVLRTALQVNPSCTVLVLSGYGTVREATEAMDLGAYGLVNKPLQMDPFRQTLRRILERTQLIGERDALRTQVQELKARVERLETIQGRMEMLAQRMGPPAPVAKNNLGSLQDLVDLHSRGLLSEDQFEAAKRSLLAQWLP
jgi:DNA-binding NtrC family response regulator